MLIPLLLQSAQSIKKTTNLTLTTTLLRKIIQITQPHNTICKKKLSTFWNQTRPKISCTKCTRLTTRPQAAPTSAGIPGRVTHFFKTCSGNRCIKSNIAFPTICFKEVQTTLQIAKLGIKELQILAHSSWWPVMCDYRWSKTTPGKLRSLPPFYHSRGYNEMSASPSGARRYMGGASASVDHHFPPSRYRPPLPTYSMQSVSRSSSYANSANHNKNISVDMNSRYFELHSANLWKAGLNFPAFSGVGLRTDEAWASHRPGSTSSSTEKTSHPSVPWSGRVSATKPTLVGVASTATWTATVRSRTTTVTTATQPLVRAQAVRPLCDWWDDPHPWPRRELVMNWLTQSCTLGLVSIESCRASMTPRIGRNARHWALIVTR